MKAIVCEMCNSNDVVKCDGLYVCQSCGTKYSTEDAKKLMVDISGSTVQVDETPKADSYRQLAREARSAGDTAKAAKYYGELVVLCPDDWEAAFFSVYYTSASCIIAQIAVAAANVSSAVKLVAKRISHLPQEEQKEICSQVLDYVLTLREALFEAARNHQIKYGTPDSYQEFCTRKEAIGQMAKDAADFALLCGLKYRAVNIYESLKETFGVWKVARLVESLETGRGVKMVIPLLEEKKAANKKNKNATVFSFIMLLVGIIGTVLCAVLQLEGLPLYISIGLAAVFALMCPVSLGILKKEAKQIQKMEEDIAHLKD